VNAQNTLALLETQRQNWTAGNAYGQDSLFEMYRDGRGVQQDNVRSYMWFDLAAARSVGTGDKSAVEHRDEIGARTTPAQIA
jgi:TPR repeat protein